MTEEREPDVEEGGGAGQWMPVADLMSGLMLIFMVLAIVFASSVVNERSRAADACGDARREIRTRLAARLAEANAVIREDGSIVFGEEETLFATGRSDPSAGLLRTLEWFVPEYIGVLGGLALDGNAVSEIRIEGHTSSEWTAGTGETAAYLLNMELSQDRTRAILAEFLRLVEDARRREWMRERLTANGLSSSNLMRRADGTEDREASRRVEFRAVLDSCERAGMTDGA